MAQLSPVKPGGAEEEVSSWSALPGGAALPVQWRSPASASCRALPFPQGAVAWWSQALSLPRLLGRLDLQQHLRPILQLPVAEGLEQVAASAVEAVLTPGYPAGSHPTG